MDTTAATERTTKKYAPRRGQILHLRFDQAAIERIDKTREIVRTACGLSLSRTAVLTLGMTTLLVDIAEQHGIDSGAMVTKILARLQ